MKKLIFCVAVVSICINLSFAESKDKKKPPEYMRFPGLNWKVGDSWVVKVWYGLVGPSTEPNGPSIVRQPMGTPVNLTFTVRDIKLIADFKPHYSPGTVQERIRFKKKNISLDKYKCFEVETEYFGSKYLLYFRTDTGNLIRVNSFDYAIDPNGPIRHDVSLFDFPDLTTKKGFFKIEDESGIIQQTIKPIMVKGFDGVEGKGWQCTIVEISKIRDKVVYKSIQKWRKGDPWWTRSVTWQWSNDKEEIVPCPEKKLVSIKRK